MPDMRQTNPFNRARIQDRQIDELIGLAHGIVADGVVSQAEAEHLQKWLVAHRNALDNPVILPLYERVNAMLVDHRLDDDEARDLLETLEQYAGGDFEIGEVVKSSTLPIDRPQPSVGFNGTRFCFTGTFVFGTRGECEAAVVDRGAVAGSLRRDTTFLVIGMYATDSWIHSSYGRKIEKAVEMKAQGIPIAIVGESHWANHLGAR
ncbi:BRCT domain-containing protein [Shumkonia mesophila]|uniref:BRCT domain-containing protein n=1 Tax=Shumkonia mesophila TaxID=2838854 RepID=UPI0029350416|nr:BRCT domain-containing protein [Shumkonia mesophila]